jgi:hypothetical protein
MPRPSATLGPIVTGGKWSPTADAAPTARGHPGVSNVVRRAAVAGANVDENHIEIAHNRHGERSAERQGTPWPHLGVTVRSSWQAACCPSPVAVRHPR